MRGSKPVVLTFAVVAVLVLAAAGVYLYSGAMDRASSPPQKIASAQPDSSPAKPGKDSASVAQSQPAPGIPAARSKPQEPAQSTSPPSLDVARIEADGNGVLAGRAEPDWRVSVESGDVSLAETKADGEGAWAVVLDKPLAPGDYHFRVKEISPDGSRSLSGGQTIDIAIAGNKGGEAVAQAGAGETASSAPGGGHSPGQDKTQALPQATAVHPSSGEDSRQKEDAGLAHAAAAAASVKAPKLAARVPIQPLPGSAAASRQVATATPAPSMTQTTAPAKETEIEPSAEAATAAAQPIQQAPASVPQSSMSPPEAATQAPAPNAEAAAVPPRQPAPEVASASTAPEAASPPSPELSRVNHPKSYSVLRGDTLWDIAETYLGGGWRYRQIAKSNRGQIHNPNRIYPDQTLDLPQD